MANFFRARRDEIEKTQFQIAVEVGVTTSTVANWERGFNPPRLQKAEKLARVYRCSKKQIIDAIVDLSQAPAAAK